MGLFSNKKDLCPVCGGATPRLFPTKVEGEALCKKCAGLIDLPAGAIDNMRLSELPQYMACHEKNASLREMFRETYRYGGGFLEDGIYFDMENRLMRLKLSDESFAFTGADITAIRITEDGRPLFTGDKNGLVCHESDIESRLENIQWEIEDFRERMRTYEHLEEVERMRDMIVKDDDHHRPYRARPSFLDREPVKQFRVQITMCHPFWKGTTLERNAPSFDSTDPSIEAFLRDYDEMVAGFRELAEYCMELIAPGAPVTERTRTSDPVRCAAPDASAAQPAAAPPVDAVTEIQRYKQLLDAGIITEEEFTAKKRQLLGI